VVRQLFYGTYGFSFHEKEHLETFAKHPFLPNPPEADKFLRLPREMPAQLNLHLIFNRGEAHFSGVMLRF
jgi:hypothetical protein